jgi:hypothetical protein
MNRWLEQWFAQPSVGKGDPTRRAVADVHKHCSDSGQELFKEAKARGWHVVETDKHYVLLPSGFARIRA